jgi:group II intron reverse transcriptase/maturase
VQDVEEQLRHGKTQVIDADISKYFDTIPHDKLMEQVAKRIVDKNILRLIKMWLTAPIVEERADGKKEYKGNDRGTPQGGVISPLLANIYLNVLDTIWKSKKVQERLGARLVRYADDIVAVCRGNTERILRGIKAVLGELGLSLNESKTKVVDAREEEFNFLGFTIGIKRSIRTGKAFPLIRPSKKAMKRIRAEIKTLTSARKHAVPEGITIRKVNETVRGWTSYFYYGNCSNDFTAMKYYLENRMRVYLRRKHRIRSKGYKRYPNEYLYEKLGLFRIPITAQWTQPVKARG